MAAPPNDGKTEKIVKLSQEVNPQTGKLWKPSEIANYLHVSPHRVWNARYDYFSRDKNTNNSQAEKEFANFVMVGDEISAPAGITTTNAAEKERVSINANKIGHSQVPPSECPKCKYLQKEIEILKSTLLYYLNKQ